MEFLEKVEFYHHLGLNPYEILKYSVEVDHNVISERTLKRVLTSVQLFRRKKYSDLLVEALFVEEKMKISDELHKYKLMLLKCIQSGYSITQETVRLLLQIIYPLGVQLRNRGKLRRRIYTNLGPDFM